MQAPVNIIKHTRSPKSKARKYTQTRRAEQQGETRQRIVEALVALHGEVGPARTSINAVAKRAGVERLTVYRHFADEITMLQACSAHFARQVPPPNPSAWMRVVEPKERLRAALLAFYDYYRRAEAMLANVYRDAPHVPALSVVLTPWAAFVDDLRHDLCARFASSEPARTRLAAVVAHALRFETWQSLGRPEAIGDAGAADLMVMLAQAAANHSSEPTGGVGGRTHGRSAS